MKQIYIYLWHVSINDHTFGDLVDRIYPIVVEIKDATDIDKSAAYHEKERLRTKFYDK
jgi:hypothetical protein